MIRIFFLCTLCAVGSVSCRNDNTCNSHADCKEDEFCVDLSSEDIDVANRYCFKESETINSLPDCEKDADCSSCRLADEKNTSALQWGCFRRKCLARDESGNYPKVIRKSDPKRCVL